MTLAELEEHQRQQEERDRLYAEMQARRRAEIDAQFNDAYTTYRAIDRYNLTWEHIRAADVIDYRTFFDLPSSLQPRPQPTETSLPERFNAAIQEADRCAQRGDNVGRVNALGAANRLRRQIIQQTLSTI